VKTVRSKFTLPWRLGPLNGPVAQLGRIGRPAFPQSDRLARHPHGPHARLELAASSASQSPMLPGPFSGCPEPIKRLKPEPM
jgi:hypothetical protein